MFGEYQTQLLSLLKQDESRFRNSTGRLNANFIQGHPWQLACQRLHCAIRWFCLKYFCFCFTIRTAHDSKPVLRLLRIVPVITPVVPDAERDIVGDVREEHTREILRLRFLAG